MQNEKKSNVPEMVLTRTLNAPRDLVWQAWTEQKHIQQWWGPKDYTNPVCEWDAKPGKMILIHMQLPDGTTFPMDGEFLEVVEPERLVFISAALDKDGKRLFEVHNTVTFTTEGNKTIMTIHAKISKIRDEGTPFIAGINKGWNSSIDKLDELLQTL